MTELNCIEIEKGNHNNISKKLKLQGFKSEKAELYMGDCLEIMDKLLVKRNTKDLWKLEKRSILTLTRGLRNEI